MPVKVRSNKELSRVRFRQCLKRRNYVSVKKVDNIVGYKLFNVCINQMSSWFYWCRPFDLLFFFDFYCQFIFLFLLQYNRSKRFDIEYIVHSFDIYKLFRFKSKHLIYNFQDIVDFNIYNVKSVILFESLYFVF